MKQLITALAALTLLVSSLTTPAHSHDGDDGHNHDAGSLERTVDPYGETPTPGAKGQLPKALTGCSSFERMWAGGETLRDMTAIGDLATEDRAAATEDRIGIKMTPAEAEAFDQGRQIRDALDAKALQEGLAARFPKTYIGAAWNHQTNGVDLYFTDVADDARALAEELSGWPRGQGTVTVHEVPTGGLNGERLHLLRQQLPKQLNQMGAEEFPRSTMTDPTCGRFVVTVPDNAAAATVEEALAKLGAPKGSYGVYIDTGNDFLVEARTRYDNHNPQSGGLVVDIRGQRCTSGVPFYSSTDTYVITAGHCVGALPFDPRSSTSDPTAFVMLAQWEQGPVNISKWDSVWHTMSGQGELAITALNDTYAGASNTIWHGGGHGVVVMDWWEWSRTQTLMYDIYCHSGLNWGSNVCGLVENPSVSATMTPPSHGYFVELTDQILVTGPSYDGDSGGTAWNAKSGHWYAGILVGGQGTARWVATHTETVQDSFPWLIAPVNMW